MHEQEQVALVGLYQETYRVHDTEAHNDTSVAIPIRYAANRP